MIISMFKTNDFVQASMGSHSVNFGEGTRHTSLQKQVSVHSARVKLVRNPLSLFFGSMSQDTCVIPGVSWQGVVGQETLHMKRPTSMHWVEGVTTVKY